MVCHVSSLPIGVSLRSPQLHDVGHRMGRLGKVVSSIRSAVHLRYSLAHVVAHLFPRFSAGSIVARCYRAAGFSIGEGVTIFGPMRVVSGTGFTENLVIGARAVISTDVTLNVDARVTIGDGASIGPFVRIYTATHQLGPGSSRMLLEPLSRPVTIGRGAWLRVGATVLPGVTIGDGAVVGAGSVVTEDVGANVLVLGNPAVVVKQLPVPES